jgi:hypothetical protein
MELRRYEMTTKTPFGQTIIQSDNGDITVSKLAQKIERAKTDSQKNALFLSVYGKDRTTLMQHIILSMPKQTYLLKREGYASPALEREISNKYGTYAGTHDIGKTVMGLSTTCPNRVSASLTHGLDEVTLRQGSAEIPKCTNATRMPRITPRMPRLR